MTTTERVLDASVVASAVYVEVLTRAARARLNRPTYFIAPDLIFPELTHVGVKKMRRGLASVDLARFALARTTELLAEVAPTYALAERAIALADQYGIGGYDAVYVALAEARGAPLLTADMKLAVKLEAGGWADLVETIAVEG